MHIPNNTSSLTCCKRKKDTKESILFVVDRNLDLGFRWFILLYIQANIVFLGGEMHLYTQCKHLLKDLNVCLHKWQSHHSQYQQNSAGTVKNAFHNSPMRRFKEQSKSNIIFFPMAGKYCTRERNQIEILPHRLTKTKNSFKFNCTIDH